MTDGERLRKIADALCDIPHAYPFAAELRRIADLLDADLAFNDSPLSLETLAWCRANLEVIEALRAGTKVAVEKHTLDRLGVGAYWPEEEDDKSSAVPKKPGE